MQPMNSQGKLLGKCRAHSRQLKEQQGNLNNSSYVIYHFHCFSNTLQKGSLELLLQATFKETISINKRNKYSFALVQAKAPAISLWNSVFFISAKLIPVTSMHSTELL